MDYAESYALMADADFRGRIKVAALRYADYIMDEGAGTPAHNARLRWATQTFQQPDQQAVQLQPPVVMDAAVQAEGAAISDAGLQSAVEGVINKMI